ncbi:hypothetical protein LP422_14755 [Janibacter limosus]|uniref:Uncharacterized protein n=1 Tax=Janibacter limosus TaxID=53458 RepID=A0AC61U1P7_9MICO|nr:hypothetical protein [Janibacter limosus]UUZ43937.1 hypothetical protein LP422_14755 [Janibacter limosus]
MSVLRRRATTTVVLCSALALILTGCGNDASESSGSSSAPSSGSSSTMYGEDHVMDQVKKANTAFHGIDPNAKIPDTAAWATAAYRKKYNDDPAKYKDIGAVVKGKVSSSSLHLASSKPDAPGGWDVTVYNCTVSTQRVYIDGKDVTSDPKNPKKTLPKGPRDSVFSDSYTTPDGGRTWQLNNTQPVTGKQADESPCAE